MDTTSSPSFYSSMRHLMEAALNLPPHESPRLMGQQELDLLMMMTISPLISLIQSVVPEERVVEVWNECCASTDVKLNRAPPPQERAIMAEQADAMGDVVYYLVNAAAKAHLDIVEKLRLLFGCTVASHGFPLAAHSEVSPSLELLVDSVREFTEQSTGVALPTAPKPLNESAVRFIVRMVVSELIECLQSSMDTDNALAAFKGYATKAAPLPERSPPPEDRDELIDRQAEDLSAPIFICFSVAAMCAYDLSKVLSEIHRSNMSKRGPDGRFTRRADGKIEKPPTFTPPDIYAVLFPASQ